MSTLWRQVSFIVSVCVGWCAHGVKAATNCTHSENVQIVRALKQPETITDALEQLRKHSRQFLILYRSAGSNSERAAKEDQVKTLHYSSLRVSAISRQSESWFVSE